jgi:CspA family cold shock protein
MYQVKWFNKRKGYGFVTGDLFVHHSDIMVSGYKYLKRGEYITGEVTDTGGKKKLSNIRAPMEGGKLMCEVEREDTEHDLGRVDRLGSAPEDEGSRTNRIGEGPVDRSASEDIRLSIPDGGLRPNAPEYTPPGRGKGKGRGRGRPE